MLGQLPMECRIAYKRDENVGLHVAQATFVEALAARLRLFIPFVVTMATAGGYSPGHSEVGVWTEVLLQGANHRPPLFIEFMPAVGVTHLDDHGQRLNGVFTSLVWSETARLMRIHPYAGFLEVAVATAFGRRASATINIFSGVVVRAVDSACGHGQRLDPHGSDIAAVYNHIKI